MMAKSGVTRWWQAQRRFILVGCVLLHLVITAGTDLTVTLSPAPQLTVMEGGVAMFSCSPLVPIALPILERDGFVVTRQDHPRISFVDRESEDGNIHSGNRTFTLRDVSLEEDDRAEFRCAVGPFLSNPLTLRVVVQPTITGPSDVIRRLEHSTKVTILDYTIFGVPPPTSIVWLHNGVSFPGNQRVSVRPGAMTTRLVIRGARREDAGNYTLVATSSVGVGALSLDLVVEYDEFLQSPRDMVLMEGEVVSMSCVHRFGLAYAWRSTSGTITNANTKVAISPSGTRLRYGPVDHYDHGLELFCIVHSELGHFYSSPLATLTVQSAPLILAPQNLTAVEGSDIQLTFSIRGYPPPTSINYYYNDEGLPLPSRDGRVRVASDGSGVLHIERVVRLDAGNYTLVVENRLGEVCATILLTVLYAPVISPLIPATIVVEVNSNVTLLCGEEVIANPSPSLSWLFEDEHSKPISLQTRARVHVDHTTGDLVITTTQYSDSGVYTCVASNSIGRSRFSITLLVRDPPSPPTNLQTIQVGPSWVVVEWTPPTTNGSFPLSLYLLSASPQPMTYGSEPRPPSISNDVITLNQGGDMEVVLDRGFPTNTACIEHMCEVTTTEAEVAIRPYANVTGLVPAVNYTLVVVSLSNGTNLRSRPSEPIYFITRTHVPSVGSVSVSAYGPGALLANWTLAYSGGVPVTNFDLSYKKVNSSTWTLVVRSNSDISIPPDFRSWILRGIESDALYTVRVSAMNMIGRGDYTTLPEPVLSHHIGGPGAPSQPTIVGWADDFALLSSSLPKPGSTEGSRITVLLLRNSSEIARAHTALDDGYVASSDFQIRFSNVSYSSDFQFRVFASNRYGVSEWSPASEFASENIQEVPTPYAIAGPAIGGAMGAINSVILVIIIALCGVMARETSRKRKSMARRMEMVQAADCPVSPRSLLFIDPRGSPDGRSRATPTLESLYAECMRRNEQSLNNQTNEVVAGSSQVVTNQPSSSSGQYASNNATQISHV